MNKFLNPLNNMKAGRAKDKAYADGGEVNMWGVTPEETFVGKLMAQRGKPLKEQLARPTTMDDPAMGFAGTTVGKIGKGVAGKILQKVGKSGLPIDEATMSKTPNRVRIPNEINAETLSNVISEMKKLGRPKIDVVDTGEEYLALEGSHRLTAAHKLGIKPIYNVIDQDSIIDPKKYDVDTYNFKWDENVPHTAGEMAWEMHSHGTSPQLDFIKIPQRDILDAGVKAKKSHGGAVRKASGGAVHQRALGAKLFGR